MNEEELARVMSRPDLVADGEEDMPGSGLRSVYSTDSFYSALGDEDEETREMLQRLHELENNSDSDVELELEALETELHRYEKRLGRRVRRSARMRASKIDADAVAKQFLRGTFVDGVEEQSVDEELKEEELWMDAMSSSDSESVGSPHSPSVSSSTSSEIRGRPGAIRRGKQTRLAGEEALPGMVSPLTPEDELTEEACFSGGEDGGFVDADEDEDEDLLNENAAGAAPPQVCHPDAPIPSFFWVLNFDGLGTQKKGRWNWLWGKFPSRQKSLDAPSSISAEASPVEDPCRESWLPQHVSRAMVLHCTVFFFLMGRCSYWVQRWLHQRKPGVPFFAFCGPFQGVKSRGHPVRRSKIQPVPPRLLWRLISTRVVVIVSLVVSFWCHLLTICGFASFRSAQDHPLSSSPHNCEFLLGWQSVCLYIGILGCV